MSEAGHDLHSVFPDAAEALLEIDPQHFRGVGDANGIVRIFGAAEWEVHDVRAGEAGVIPAGFVGAFEVLSPVRKYFVVQQVSISA